MQHHFNVEIAREFGILEAVLLENINFWIAKNAANEKNYYDGDYWTYNSIRAFAKLFPYATERQIKYALNKLKDAGVIKTANYNQNAYDHTLWYGLTEKGKSIVSSEKVDLTAVSNRKTHNVQPIPYNKPDNKQHISTNTNVLVEAKPQTYGNQSINNLFNKWEEIFGYKQKDSKQNRYAASNMLRAKDKGEQWLIQTMTILYEAQKDKFAGNYILGISNFADLQQRYDAVWKWGATRYARNQDANESIDI